MTEFDKFQTVNDINSTVSIETSNIKDDKTVKDKGLARSEKNGTDLKSNDPVHNSTSVLKSPKTTPEKLESSSSVSPRSVADVKEEKFIRSSVKDILPIKILSAQDLDRAMTAIFKSISNRMEAMSKRVDSFKTLRSLVMSGVAKYDNFFMHLKRYEKSFLSTTQDIYGPWSCGKRARPSRFCKSGWAAGSTVLPGRSSTDCSARFRTRTERSPRRRRRPLSSFRNTTAARTSCPSSATDRNPNRKSSVGRVASRSNRF